MRWIRLIAMLYGVLCVAALLLIPASRYGWFGLEPAPLGGIYAIILAVPWSAALTRLEPGEPLLAALLLALGMAANIGILLGLGKLLGTRFR